MTPRQFGWLWDEHTESLAHAEMVNAFTTAAVMNSRPWATEGVSALDYMPSHRDFTVPPAEVELTEEQQDARDLYQQKIAQVAAELRAGRGSCLSRLLAGEMV